MYRTSVGISIIINKFAIVKKTSFSRYVNSATVFAFICCKFRIVDRSFFEVFCLNSSAGINCCIGIKCAILYFQNACSNLIRENTISLINRTSLAICFIV